MNTSKRISTVLFAGALFALGAACGSKNDDAAAPGAQVPRMTCRYEVSRRDSCGADVSESGFVAVCRENATNCTLTDSELCEGPCCSKTTYRNVQVGTGACGAQAPWYPTTPPVACTGLATYDGTASCGIFTYAVDSPCDVCYQTRCCSCGEACADGSECQVLEDCINACPSWTEEQCLRDCVAATPNAYPTWAGAFNCMLSKCSPECLG